MTLSDRDMAIYAAVGFSVWLGGAVEIYYTGGWLFQTSAAVTALSALFVAVAVCLIFRSTMRWMKSPLSQSVTVAVLMGLPGLFGEAVRQLFFGWATGLRPATQPAFAATLFFGNAVLLAYAVWRQRNAR